MISANGIFQIAFFFIVSILVAYPLGLYMERVYNEKAFGLEKVFGGFERFIYRITGVNPEEEMDWKKYAMSMLIFNGVGMLILYIFLRWQNFLPLNPQDIKAASPDLAFNTASSFVTNTNWQSYSHPMSFFTQMFGLTVQNFLSAATGMSIAIAVIRGIVRKESKTIGNFWVDITRSTLYILLPLAFVVSIILVSQGVIQNFAPYVKVYLIDPIIHSSQIITKQVIPMGPVASEESIKMLGTNGGGFFGTNSAFPFENPTPFSNFIEILSIIIIPLGLTFTFGKMVGKMKEGIAILLAMLIILIPMTFVVTWYEGTTNPAITAMGVYGGNMEGKEVNLGIAGSALFTSVTTGTSCGAVNSMLDSYTPMGGFVPLFLMMLGEVAPGGVGSGLYGILAFVIIAVFIAGLMVGRTPEYLGKKIDAFEMKMVTLSILIMPLLVLISTAVALMIPAGKGAILNPGPQGFEEVLYAFTSMANNNGSAFAGLSANNPFYNILGGFVMLIGRFGTAIPMLAFAGSLAKKSYVSRGIGTLPTDDLTFSIWLVFVILIIGALNFFAAWSLGPFVQQLMMK